MRHRLFTCLLKASLRARKWWSQDSTYSTHSLRLFPKLSLSVVHVRASVQQRDSSGVWRKDTQGGWDSCSIRVGGWRPFAGHLSAAFLPVDHPLPVAMMWALDNRIEI